LLLGPVALFIVSVAAQEPSDWEALPFDDECLVQASGETECGVSALQRRRLLVKLHGPALGASGDEEDSDQASYSSDTLALDDDPAASSTRELNRSLVYKPCDGPWCKTIEPFNKLFDTDNPALMQSALNMYSEWATDREGIKVAVTKNHYYEMYHPNVHRKLEEYLPQGFFGWKFDHDKYALVKGPTDNMVVLARKGTMMFNLGWWKRQMFWNAVIKTLPPPATFHDDNIDTFDDCQLCTAKMLYTLRKGGLKGLDEEWKITDLVLEKLDRIA